ncbi:hypothetical protein M8C21_009815, partial [Ambrosia artemisiifolia]
GLDSRRASSRTFFLYAVQTQHELVIMSGLQTHDLTSTLGLTKAATDHQGPTVVSTTETKPKKKICCACPDTKKLRDECIVEHGESACSKWIEAHRLCLRSEGGASAAAAFTHLRSEPFGALAVNSKKAYWFL